MWIQTIKGDWINTEHVTRIRRVGAVNSDSVPVVADVLGQSHPETITYCNSWQAAGDSMGDLIFHAAMGTKTYVVSQRR